MIYTEKLEKAIKFAIKTHEVYQKQKRKGKDIAYISHPLTVGMILSRAGADEDLVVAGILHDTIEDSIEGREVTEEMLKERFGERVASLVDSVTEKREDLSWEEKKNAAIADLEEHSRDALLLKSADVVANLREILEDHQKEGEAMFKRFNAPRDILLRQKFRTIDALYSNWPENPLRDDLQDLAEKLGEIKRGKIERS